MQPAKGLRLHSSHGAWNKTKKEMQRIWRVLSRLVEVVVRRIRKIKAPAETTRKAT